MRSSTTSRRILAMAAAAAVMATQAYAQTARDAQPNHSDEQIFEEKIGRMAVEYWSPKLNEYRSRVDGILSTPDREELNRMRVRWSLFNEGMHQERQKIAPVTPHEEQEVTFEEAGVPEGMLESVDIYITTKKLAEKYRPELDELSNTVLDDLAAFMNLLGAEAEKFRKDHPEAGQNGYNKQFEEEIAAFDAASMKNAMRAVYPFGIEPVVMLYDGTELGKLLGEESSGIIAGLELPDMSALRQNIPNPATSSTTITYVLNEASSATIIRIFDARGDLKETIDQGPRPAGEHSVNLNVSSYPSGAYLYHLTVRTNAGDRVYSRAMQVVK